MNLDELTEDNRMNLSIIKVTKITSTFPFAFKFSGQGEKMSLDNLRRGQCKFAYGVEDSMQDWIQSHIAAPEFK